MDGGNTGVNSKRKQKFSVVLLGESNATYVILIVG